MHVRLRAKALLTGVALVGLLGACQDAGRVAASPGSTSPAASAEAHTTPTPDGAQTPPPAAVTAQGVAEPNRQLTPGSVFTSASVSQICVSGYTKRVRNVPPATRRAVFAAYGIAYPPKTGAYELDHPVPLELGGDNAASNLWPQPYHGSAGSADVKDHLENHLHALVCSRQVPLAAAQAALQGDWYVAAQKYNSVAVQVAPVGPQPVRTPASAAPAVAPGGGATAKCNDGTYSYAAHHQGACSHHGGVAMFYK